jgi:transcriptional regulator with XRE-family HTH domain
MTKPNVVFNDAKERMMSEMELDFAKREAAGVSRSLAEKLELCRRNQELAEMVRKLAGALDIALKKLRTIDPWPLEIADALDRALAEVPDEFRGGE